MERKSFLRGLNLVGISVLGERDILVVNTLENNEPYSESDVVESHHQVVNGLIARPSVLKVSNILGSGVDNTLV